MTYPADDITWTGAVPASRRYGDPYYSLENGLAEAQHVFLAGNRLPDRLRPGFVIAELGFGTGLNLLAALQAARTLDALPLTYVGFEAHPMPAADMRKALAAFPGVEDELGWFTDAWATGPRIRTDALDATIIIGDARETLPEWDGKADAWFLDGFAPARNPELWEPSLMEAVARHTAPGGTAATYSAAGHVRWALTDAGFTVERCPGYGRKRHMTVARLP